MNDLSSIVCDYSQARSNAMEFVRLIHPDNRQVLGRKFRDNPNFEVFRGIFSSDPRYKSFMKQLYKSCVKAFPMAEKLPSGFPKSPIIGDFSKLRTMPGSVRVPLSFARHRPDRTLSPAFRSFVKEAVPLFFKHIDPMPGLISVDSSSGAPFFRSGDDTKHRHLTYISKNLEFFRRAYEKLDREILFKKLYILMMATTQIRLQSDVWKDGSPKVRDFESFATHFCGISEQYKDNTLFDSWFARCRTRVVVAEPAAINNMLSDFFEPYRRGYQRAFASSFKHQEIEKTIQKLSGCRSIQGVDIKQFDSNVPEEFIQLVIDAMPIPELIKNLVKDMLYIPWYCSDVDGKGLALATQSPFDKEFKTWKGLASGIAITSFMNDIEASICTYWEYRQVVGCSFENFLLHRGRIKAVIKGDDALHASEVVDLSKWTFKNEVVHFERENFPVFLGNVLYLDDGIKSCLNLESYLTKSYIPEKPITSKFRPYPYFGWNERRKQYASNPFFEELAEIERRLWFDIFKVRFDQLLARYAQDDEHKLLLATSSSSMSRIDIEVLQSPEKIHYKYLPEDISKNVLDLITRRVDDATHERLQTFFRRLNE